MFGLTKRTYKLCVGDIKELNLKFFARARLSVNQSIRQYARKISLEEFTGKKKTFYQVLGVNSNATHSEIKSAYYTLSMAFHPDKNKGDETAAIRFREITEAYEILGSSAKRKRYDQGMSIRVPGFNAPGANYDEEEEEEIDLRKRGTFKSRVPTQTGRTSAYNYDEWVKLHYERTLHKQWEIRNNRSGPTSDSNFAKRDQSSRPSQMPTLLAFYLFMMMLGLIITIQSRLTDEYRFEKSFSKDQK